MCATPPRGAASGKFSSPAWPRCAQLGLVAQVGPSPGSSCPRSSVSVPVSPRLAARTIAAAAAGA
eukprot:342975-Alexandrium_andersonii.AAC.1